MEEIFCDIKGYEGLYQVSNYGRVRSLNYLRTGEIRMMRYGKYPNGYLFVGLSKNGKVKNFLVHCLVADAFIPNPDGLPEVNHIDEDKMNNCVWNLEWCDHKYNCNYGTRNERISKRVYQYTRDGSFIRSYASTREAECKTGINQSSICVVANNGRLKSAGGYIWSFIPPKPTDYRALW